MHGKNRRQSTLPSPLPPYLPPSLPPGPQHGPRPGRPPWLLPPHGGHGEQIRLHGRGQGDRCGGFWQVSLHSKGTCDVLRPSRSPSASMPNSSYSTSPRHSLTPLPSISSLSFFIAQATDRAVAEVASLAIADIKQSKNNVKSRR